MFFCRRNPLLTLLMMLLGFKFIKRERMTSEERAEYRAKRRAFRQKMREAFDVWDESADDAQADVNPSAES